MSAGSSGLLHPVERRPIRLCPLLIFVLPLLIFVRPHDVLRCPRMLEVEQREDIGESLGGVDMRLVTGLTITRHNRSDANEHVIADLRGGTAAVPRNGIGKQHKHRSKIGTPAPPPLEENFHNAA